MNDTLYIEFMFIVSIILYIYMIIHKLQFLTSIIYK